MAGVAHELNTPVGNALTVSSTLSEQARQLRADVLGNQIRKSQLLQFADNVVPMTELIESSCLRAASLISSFKRVAVDQTSELRREFDLRDLVLDILAAIRPGLKNLPYAIESRVPEHMVCEGYPGPLGQVITNLVQNAAVHAFEGKPDGHITISAQLDGDEVEIEVADNGNGIPPEIRKRIFEPFFTTRLGKGGSGLGLAISSNIARSVLHGSLQVKSTPGEGSCFVVRFPRKLPVGPVPVSSNG